MRAAWLGLSILAGMVVSVPALSSVHWRGAGYYIEDDAGVEACMIGLCDTVLIAGPFSGKAKCQIALAHLSSQERKDSACEYFTRDPNRKR